MRNECAPFALKKTLSADLLRKMIATGKSVPSTRSATDRAVINATASRQNVVGALEPAGRKDLVCPEEACELRTSEN